MYKQMHACMHAYLVAGEHPDLDTSLAQIRKYLRHAILQLVLDGGGALG